MTTNAGASDPQKRGIGFSDTRKQGDDGRDQRLFTEFRNRLDAIISFAALDEIILRVVDKFPMRRGAVAREEGRGGVH